MYQKIMVPVDDSKTALRALEEACHVAQAVGASVYAVHVVDLAQFNWGTAEFTTAWPCAARWKRPAKKCWHTHPAY